jgi:hypothetical protein
MTPSLGNVRRRTAKNLRPDIPIQVSKKAVNDPEFSSRAAEWLLELVKQKPQGNERCAQRNSKRCKRQLGKRTPLDYFDILVLCLPKRKS